MATDPSIPFVLLGWFFAFVPRRHLGGFLLFLALAVAGGAREAADEAAPGIMRYGAHDSCSFSALLNFLNELARCSCLILRKNQKKKHICFQSAPA
jgi:hypothetical protein